MSAEKFKFVFFLIMFFVGGVVCNFYGDFFKDSSLCAEYTLVEIHLNDEQFLKISMDEFREMNNMSQIRVVALLDLLADEILTVREEKVDPDADR